MKAHPEARDLVAAINRRNGELIARADAAVWDVLRALLMTALAVVGGIFLAEYFTTCESAAHLCMAVVGLHSRRSVEPPLNVTELQGKVLDVVAAARAGGELDGHRLGFIEGTRRGVVTGFCWGITCGVVLMAAALQAGWLVGYL